MNGSNSAVAVRNGSAPAQQDAALALVPGQTMWTRDQHAALVAMGIPAKASSAELGVFLHTCQRLRLDPFLRQIYLIYRRTKENGAWVDKPTIQIGIDGFRVTRDRICAERGVSVEYEDTVWYHPDGSAHEVWLWDYPPAACKFVVKVDGRRFPATLNFKEYAQTRKAEDGTQVLNSMWQTKSSHQIEKCSEAEGLRKAFPNDLSGVILTDAAPLDDLDAPDRLPSDRPRVTAEQAKARAPQTVTATVTGVVTPHVPPAGEQPGDTPSPAAASPAPPEEPAGGTRKPKASKGQVGLVRAAFERLYPGPETDEERLVRLDETARLAEYSGKLGSTNELSADEAARVIRALDRCKTSDDLKALLGTGEVPSGE